MTPEIIALLKLSISVYFSIADAYAADEAELDDIYQEEKAKFTRNTPDRLEDV